MEEKNTINILLDQLEKQHKLTSVLTNGLVKVSIGILISVVIIAVFTVTSYFWCPQDWTSQVSGDNNTTTQTIGGDN